MKSVSGKDFCKLLKSHGWSLIRIAGSHHIYGKEGRRERVSVPVHGNADLKHGLQRALMRIAEISESEL